VFSLARANRALPLVCLLPLCNWSFRAAEPQERTTQPPPELLSIRESLVPVLACHGQGSGVIRRPRRKKADPYSLATFPYDRLNPGAARYLRAYLVQEAPSARSRAMLLLACIGTEADVTWMEKHADLSIEHVGASGEGGMSAAPQFSFKLGIYAGIVRIRYPELGKRLVSKYSSVGSWGALGKTVPVGDSTSAERACMSFLRAAYLWSKASDVLAVIRGRLAKPGESSGFTEARIQAMVRTAAEMRGYASYSRPREISREEQDRAVAKCLERYGSQIDAFMRKVGDRDVAPAPAVADLPLPAPSETMDAARRVPPAPVAASRPAAAYTAALLREGLAAYVSIADAWREGEMEQLRGCLLDDAEPIDGAKFDRLLRTPQEIDRQKQILLAIAELGQVTPRDFRIELKTTASSTFSTVPLPGGAGKVLAAESATLTFTIPKSGSVARTHLPERLLYPERVRTANGDLRIYMRKLNGRWHWNPFAW